ncbi:MFS transporter [Alicyclobacillus ferrooxydans]|uniref:MFS transporter n=1 Tax=Alicyclobacillus ferrooxydans TaxID=471514 RepID=A0A0P9CTZ0_9BACL|nr:MFS transporter [Alicyclobacillus ferrooxydans]
MDKERESLESLSIGAERHSSYKWIALANCTLGVLMASINSSILIIALPVIFAGLKVNPLAGNQTSLLLWVMLGFNVATTVLLVTFGRLSDIFGRVRLYNLGFAVFTIGSILCSITWSKGTSGELELIIFRLIQGVGGAFLFSNSAAILTDAFPENQRGLALGLNQIAGVGGGVIGLVVGGLLAATGEWRWVFLVNVPVGLVGTVWAYISLREISKTSSSRRLDVLGNFTLGLGILGIMLGLTYGIMPYGTQSMGWGNPFVIGSLIVGVVMLVLFVVIESKVHDPLFHLGLFRIRAFALGNVANFASSLARGGLQFMLIIWLQGIWLPLHGVSFANTPLQAGIDTLPQMLGFLAAGPISGYLSDRYGVRVFTTGGMILSAVGFYLLNTLPVNFHYVLFAVYLLIIGIGMGLFASPNSAAIMNAVPAVYRGVGSGMRATFMNAGMMMSMGVFFSIVVAGLAQRLPHAMITGLTSQGIPMAVASKIAHLPPTASLFAALLGFNPLQSLLPKQVLAHLPAKTATYITGKTFFPNLIGPSFMHGLALAFIISLFLSLIAAVASFIKTTQAFHYTDPDVEASERNVMPNSAQEAFSQ